MSRADQVAERLSEAAEHPKAVLLFSIGAERPTPESAARAARALGLTVAEEKLAKWVGVAKRDANALWGVPFLDILQRTIKKGGQIMEVQRGRGFFNIKTAPLIENFIRQLHKTGVEFTLVCGSVSRNKIDIEPDCKFGWDHEHLRLIHINRDVHKAECVSIYHRMLDGEGWFGGIDCGDNGLLDLQIRIRDRKAMKAVRAFAHAWETKSRQLKGSREAKVTIFQDYVMCR